jgi:DNA-3-methyladenine glycosylase I
LLRCWWSGSTAEYRAYHDLEWGRPTVDDRSLFEKLCLEGFQAGLSWLTILRKRENFRTAFHNFDVSIIAEYDQRDVDRLLADSGIVRHRGKIESTINNAHRALDLTESGSSLSELLWSFAPEAQSRPDALTRALLMESATSVESTALSKHLKRNGWSFVGPTTLYALMQAMGLVNDHQYSCHVRDDVENERQSLITRQEKR